MNPAPAARQLGDYKLREFLGQSSVSNIWLAEQVSISRMVILDELREDRQDQMAEFLADIRAKAAVDHPLVGSVYEASAVSGKCFCAHELLPGVTLGQRLESGETFDPGKLANLLRRVSEAQLQAEALGYASDPINLEAIHIDAHGVVRLKNLAIAGARGPDQSSRDVTTLGEQLPPLISNTQAGATRMLTLFGWMRGEGLEAPLSWGQTRDFCLQIEHQLADPLSVIAPRAGAKGSKKPTFVVVGIATGLVIVAIAFLAFKVRPPVKSDQTRADLPEPVAVATGMYPTPDGSEESLPGFRIAANETTIGQYAEFLSTLDVLAKDNREHIFDHSQQAAEKISHEPDDWVALFAAAKSGGSWKNQTVTLDTPVVGIDWWDAVAYAEWKKGRLPTQEEWFAALNLELRSPTGIKAGGWLPVTGQTTDRTPAGLLGMAGSVAEWTAKTAPNPANPLGEKFWVITGGSYLKASSNALTREWVNDRSLRRPDLGFRIVWDAR